MKRQTKHRKKRRELGKCAREGCPVETGDRYFCEPHAAYQRARNKVYRQQKAAAAALVRA